jgi:hypothetical protein
MLQQVCRASFLTHDFFSYPQRVLDALELQEETETRTTKQVIDWVATNLTMSTQPPAINFHMMLALH